MLTAKAMMSRMLRREEHPEPQAAPDLAPVAVVASSPTARDAARRGLIDSQSRAAAAHARKHLPGRLGDLVGDECEAIAAVSWLAPKSGVLALFRDIQSFPPPGLHITRGEAGWSWTPDRATRSRIAALEAELAVSRGEQAA